MQVPGNFGAPSHRLMREVAARQPRAADLGAGPGPGGWLATPGAYLGSLATLALEPDVWVTTYQHMLDPPGAQDNPVLEWVRGTGLRPVLEVLTDEAERQAFLERVRRRAGPGLPPALGSGPALPADLRRGSQATAAPSPLVAQLIA